MGEQGLGRWLLAISLMAVVAMILPLLASCGKGGKPQTTTEPTQEVRQDMQELSDAELEAVITREMPVFKKASEWACTPMKERTTVVLAVESGANAELLGSYRDEILRTLNIDLKVVPHPFSEQYQILMLDMSSGAGQYDIVSFWPTYLGDFAPFLEDPSKIAPGDRIPANRGVLYPAR